MFIAGEGLDRGARGVLGVALHEAAHAAAAVRRIQDTSRQGRYHNVRYRRLAEELGLPVEQMDGFGWEWHRGARCHRRGIRRRTGRAGRGTGWHGGARRAAAPPARAAATGSPRGAVAGGPSGFPWPPTGRTPIIYGVRGGHFTG